MKSGGSEVLCSPICMENHPEVRVEIVAIPDAFISHGNPEVLKKEAGMDALSVYKKIKEAYEG